jgi:hypothetical protein
MSETIKMEAPEGVSGAFVDGESYEINSDGIFLVKDIHVDVLILHGFSIKVEEKKGNKASA